MGLSFEHVTCNGSSFMIQKKYRVPYFIIWNIRSVPIVKIMKNIRYIFKLGLLKHGFWRLFGMITI